MATGQRALLEQVKQMHADKNKEFMIKKAEGQLYEYL